MTQQLLTRRSRFVNAIDGVVLLDKPSGMTSNRALQCVRTIYRAKKAGHTGSLDPITSGVLPLVFGKGTKMAELLLHADKSYLVHARLGVATTTGDCEGEVIAEKPVAVDRQMLEQMLDDFRGDILQVPPMYSAIKHQGTPLYALARQGKEVAREPRPVRVDTLTLVSYTGAVLTLRVDCSKGTYIRTLVSDIGETIGCGAHVIGMRRTRVAGLCEQQTTPLAVLEALLASGDTTALAKHMRPITTIIDALPTVTTSAPMRTELYAAQPAPLPQPMRGGGFVQLLDDQGMRIGIGELRDDGASVALKQWIGTNHRWEQTAMANKWH